MFDIVNMKFRSMQQSFYVYDHYDAIGADSTGSTGNFAPVLMKEPGQTPSFAQVTFRGLLMCN